VIEDYPDDEYGPSCLILGFAANGKAIQIQCGTRAVRKEDSQAGRLSPSIGHAFRHWARGGKESAVMPYFITAR